MIAVVGAVIELGLRSWVSDIAGDHRIHEIMFTTMVLVAAAGVAVQVLTPRYRSASLQVAIVETLIGTLLSAATGARSTSGEPSSSSRCS